MSNDDLIDRLRIEPAVSDERRRSGWLFVVLAAVLLTLAVAGWAWYSRAAVPEVRVSLSEMIEVEGASSRASVLDASGYVVARRQATVASLQARLQAQREQIHVAEREVALQRQRIEKMTVRAPFSGVVIARAAQAGEMVSPVSAGGGFTRTGICTIVDMNSLEIEVDVNEAYIDRVEQGQPVVARLDAYPNWEIPAEVLAVVPAADRQKATVRVRIAFVERDPRILPEMGISVRFLAANESEGEAAEQTQPRRLARIPQHAVVSEDGRDHVFVVDGDTVERRAVRLGARRGEYVLVVAGLSGGEPLVAQAVDQELSDGARACVVSRSTPARKDP